MDFAGPRVEQRERIMDLGDRADRAAARMPAVQRPDRYGRRDPLDPLGIRLIQLLEELTCIGREGLDVTALSFRVKRVERQRTLPGAADARHDDQPIQGQVEVDPLEIVGAESAQLHGSQ
jgi:hypothetical protein